MFKRLRDATKKSVAKPLTGVLTTSGTLDIVHRTSRADELREEMPKLFGYLVYVEFALVALIGVCVTALAIYSAVWIVFGCGDEIHSRVVRVVRGINDNWRVDLLILVPLFFRPLFKFLFFLRKGPWGIESGQLSPKEAKVGAYSPDEKPSQP
jgi:hypothetical protein